MQTIQIQPDNLQEVIDLACQVLQKGGLVIYPTETIYGIGADAGNHDAINKLLKYKNRPAGRAISVLVKDRQMAEQYVEINHIAETAYASFLPGPVTVVSKSKNQVDKRLQSELGSLGIRISSNLVASAIVSTYGKAITATSANASGKPRPYTISQILDNLSEKQIEMIDLIIDAGQLPPRRPSTVLDTTNEVQTVHRVGDLDNLIMPPIISRSESETKAFAKQFVDGLHYELREKPLIIALQGDLGAGKTQFVKGVAQSLGISDNISSPTYNLMKEYVAEHRLVHMDLWRLNQVGLNELLDESYRSAGNCIVIEWPNPILIELKQMPGWLINLEHIDENSRRISVTNLS